MIKVKAMTDDSGHWYVLPNELADSFGFDLETEDLADSGYFDTLGTVSTEQAEI